MPAAPSSAPAAAPAPSGAADAAQAASAFSFLSLAFYRPLFDVTTKGVLRRLLAAFWGFLRPSLLQFADYVPTSTEDADAPTGATAPMDSGGIVPGLGEADASDDASLEGGAEGGPGGPVSLFTTKPDLYGPLWINATLVFLIGAMANFGAWATFDPAGGESLFKYDFSLVTQAFGLVFGALVLVPAAAWAVLRYHGAPPVALTTLVCLWGYSMVHYIPATMLCAVPSVALRWAAAAFAAAGAALFLIRSLVPLLRAAHAFVPAATGTIAVLQLVVGLLLRLYFFSFSLPSTPAKA